MKKKIKYTLGLISLTAIGAISIASIVSCSNSSNNANSTSNKTVASNKSSVNASSTPSTNKSTSNSNSTNNSVINNKTSQSKINNASNNTQQNSTSSSSKSISSSNNTNNKTQTTKTSSNSINNNVNNKQNNSTKSTVSKPSTSSNTNSQTKTNPNNTNSSKSISNINNNPSNTNNQSKQNSNTNKSQKNTNPIVKQTQPVSTNSNSSSSSSNTSTLSQIQNNYELYVEHSILNWINSNENVNNSQNSSFNDLVKQNMAGYEILNNFQSFSNFKVSFTKLPSKDASSLGSLANDEWLTITAVANEQINFTAWNGSSNNGNGGWGTNVIKTVPKSSIFTWTLPYALNTLTCINSQLSLTLNTTYSNWTNNESLYVPFGLSIGTSSDLTSISQNWQYEYHGVIATNFGTNGEDYILPSTWNMSFNENAAVANALNY